MRDNAECSKIRNEAVIHATIHTVHVLLTSQPVGGVPPRQGQADHDHSHNKHHDGRQDRDQDFRLQPRFDPHGKVFTPVDVTRQRGNSTYNRTIPL